MTSAKVLDVVAGLFGCAGQASDAVSACSEIAETFFRSDSADIWFGYHDQSGQKLVNSRTCGSSFKDFLLTVRTVILQEHAEMVAGDVKGAAWRQSSSEPRPITIIEETFVNTSLRVPPGPTPLWGPEGVPGEWSDVRGSLKPPGSERERQVRKQGVCTILFDMLGIRHTDQSCHHEVWVHLSHVNARLVDRVTQNDRSRRQNQKKRNSP